jgi:hypothetical protein
MSYFVGYSHAWTCTGNLRSAVVYSQATLDSISAEGPSAYREGRYLAVNTTYQWQIHVPPPATAPLGTQPGLHYGFVGIEYLYAERETLGNGRGNDQRVQATIGLKF